MIINKEDIIALAMSFPKTMEFPDNWESWSGIPNTRAKVSGIDIFNTPDPSIAFNMVDVQDGFGSVPRGQMNTTFGELKVDGELSASSQLASICLYIISATLWQRKLQEK